MKAPLYVGVALVFVGCAASTPESKKDTKAKAAAEFAPPKVEETSLKRVGLDPDAIDKTVNPCDDFYRYACGAWIDRTKIPADRPRWVRSFSEIQKRNQEDLKKILLAEQAKETQLGRFFGACMNEVAVDRANTTPLKPWLDRIQKLASREELAQLVADMHKHAIWPLFDISAVQDRKDARVVTAGLDQAGIGLPDRDYYLSNDPNKVKIREAYAAHIERALQLAGDSAVKAKAVRLDVMRLETALAKASKSKVARRDPVKMYNPTSLELLAANAPGFAWKEYFKTLAVPGVKTINLTSPKFFMEMGALLKREMIPAWRNYLRWRLLEAMSPVLSKKFVDEDFMMTKALTGQKEQRPRWKRCVAMTNSLMGDLLAQPFVKLRFGGDSKAAAERYVEGISRAFYNNLQGLDWMDAPTKKAANKKLVGVSYLIGYPDKWKEYTFTAGHNFFDNVMAASAFAVADNLAQIGKPVDKQRWEMTAPTVNAYYNPPKNQMVFPAGILQPPFYSVSASPAVNLGAMGFVVGHELTHGFDDQGSKFDTDGNLKSWWSEGVKKKFEAKTQCMVKQYGGYSPVAGEHINGKLTLGENIADNGGLKIAYAAFKDMRRGAKTVQRADGLSESQQFFLSAAQIWCSKMTDDYARLMVHNDPHSAPRFRVNGPLSNLPEFAEAYGCPAGSPMNPAKRCAVW